MLPDAAATAAKRAIRPKSLDEMMAIMEQNYIWTCWNGHSTLIKSPAESARPGPENIHIQQVSLARVYLFWLARRLCPNGSRSDPDQVAYRWPSRAAGQSANFDGGCRQAAGRTKRTTYRIIQISLDDRDMQKPDGPRRRRRQPPVAAGGSQAACCQSQPQLVQATVVTLRTVRLSRRGAAERPQELPAVEEATATDLELRQQRRRRRRRGCGR